MPRVSKTIPPLTLRDLKETAAQLRRVLEEKGLKQQDLPLAESLSATAVKGILSGKRDYLASSLFMLCRQVGISFGELDPHTRKTAGAAHSGPIAQNVLDLLTVSPAERRFLAAQVRAWVLHLRLKDQQTKRKA